MRLELPGGVIDLDSGAIDGARPGRLSDRELALLRYIAERPNEAVPRQTLQTEVLGLAERAVTRIVDKVVMSLRAKVEADRKQPVYIVTVQGVGYRWVPPQRGAPSCREPNAFLGRTDEIRATLGLLEAPGVVTLLGTGGVGKTRLARRIAALWSEGRGSEAIVCDLTAARTWADLVQAIANELGIPTENARQLGDAVAARGPGLLVLDNFEHLGEHAGLAAELSRVAPALRVLVTSRVALELDCERVFRLEPLPADDAVELLCRRAGERGARVEPDEVCLDLVRALDGLPLAVELAAARTPLQSPAQILARLREHGVLGPHRRGRRASRHASLRATLDWSWQNLSDDERHAIARLSTFAGGFTADLAARVIGELPDGTDALVALEGLAASSWVASQDTERGKRLHLLEHVRAYAAEQLRSRPAAERQHGEVYARLARECSDELEGARQAEAVAVLRAEVDNLRVACARAIERGDDEVAGWTGALAVGVLRLRGADRTAAELSEALLRLPDPSPEVLAMCWFARGVALIRSAPDDAREAFERAAGLAAAAERRELEVRCRRLSGRLAETVERGEQLLDEALARAESALQRGKIQSERVVLAVSANRLDEAQRRLDEAWRDLSEGPLSWKALLRAHQGHLHLRTDRLHEADATYRRAIRELREVGDIGNALVAETCRGEVKLELGDWAAARCLHEDLVDQIRRRGLRSLLAAPLGRLARVRTVDGDLEAAEELVEEARALAAEFGGPATQLELLGALVRLRVAQGRADEAIELAEEALATAPPELQLAAVHVALIALRGSGRRAGVAEMLRRFRSLAEDRAPTASMAAEVAEIEAWASNVRSRRR